MKFACFFSPTTSHSWSLRPAEGWPLCLMLYQMTGYARGLLHISIFLYFYYLSSFSFWNRVPLCSQDGLAPTMSPIRVSESLAFSCPSSHVLGLITGIHSGLYLFLIIMMFKKIPPVFYRYHIRLHKRNPKFREI